MKNHHSWWWYMVWWYMVWLYMVSKRLKFTWCWLDGDFFRHVPFWRGRLSYSFEILRRRWSVDADLMVIFTVIWWDIHGISSGILIGLLKQGWNNFRPSSSKLIKKTIDNHGSWGFIYKMVICWVFHDESHISWYLYWLSIHRGTGHPSQPRVVPLAGPRSLGDCSAKKIDDQRV